MLEAWERFNAEHGPCQISVSGLEPMFGDKSIGVLARLSEQTVLDINTNLAFPPAVLKRFERPEHVFFSASFHPAAGVSAPAFIEKIRQVEIEGFTVTGASVVGHPPYLPQLPEWQRQFAAAGVDFVVRPCDGVFEGRRLPQEYTPAERNLLTSFLSESALDFQLDLQPARGRLCAAGWLYCLVQPDGTVFRCPQGRGDVGGLNFYRDPVLLRDHPSVCDFEHCWCEDLWVLHLSPEERCHWLGGRSPAQRVKQPSGKGRSR